MPIIRYSIRGHVQGVGFRYFVRSAARALRVAGWVRNAADGSVEAVASGSPESLNSLEHKLRLGPPQSRVESVIVEQLDAVGAELPVPFLVLRNV